MGLVSSPEETREPTLCGVGTQQDCSGPQARRRKNQSCWLLDLGRAPQELESKVGLDMGYKRAL